jgi:hypothetical protein
MGDRFKSLYEVEVSEIPSSFTEFLAAIEELQTSEEVLSYCFGISELVAQDDEKNSLHAALIQSILLMQKGLANSSAGLYAKGLASYSKWLNWGITAESKIDYISQLRQEARDVLVAVVGPVAVNIWKLYPDRKYTLAAVAKMIAKNQLPQKIFPELVNGKSNSERTLFGNGGVQKESPKARTVEEYIWEYDQLELHRYGKIVIPEYAVKGDKKKALIASRKAILPS